MKIPILALILAPLAALAVERPLHWTSDISRVADMRFDAMHGDALDFKVDFNANGKPVDMTGLDATLYWQTNGMGSAWWSAPGAISNATARALFPSSADPGEKTLNFYLALSGDSNVVYGASARVTFRNSPGLSPNMIAPPIVTIDFNTIEVANAPYYTKDETDAAIGQATPEDYDEVSALARSALQSYTESDPVWNAEKSDYATKADLSTGQITVNSAEYAESARDAYNADYATLAEGLRDGPTEIYANTIFAKLNAATATNALQDAELESHASQLSQLSQSLDGKVPTSRTINGKALSANISLTTSDVGAATTSALQNLSSQVTAISGHLNAEDARFVSTNYNSEVHLPEASVEVSVSNEWLTVWREMTRWDAFVGSGFDWTSWGGFLSWMSTTETALDQKADRAWGYYDSHTGEWAPEGYTQVSSSNILIAAGMGYQRTVSSGHTYWVLTANEPYEVSGISSNGFFRVADADGNVQFEIIKGDKRTVPAPPDGVSASGGVIIVSYPVASQPTVEVSLTLADGGTWYAEDSASCPATVAWSGTSGAYVATVTPSAPTAQLFVKASYQVGGETFINNRAPISITGGIYFNGTLYMPTVSGNELKFIAQ